jgi:hypothetical protein
MSRLEEVKAFARDYINGNQTKERRNAIRAAYFQITGNNLRHSCGTCYIEAIFKILKHMEKKPCKYKLRKGAVLQSFGNADMFCTADNLTDERAEWHLKNTRGAASLFEKMPEDAPEFGDLEIVQPAKAEAPKAEAPKVAQPAEAKKTAPKRTKKK